MGKAKITITGTANKPPKIKDDKTVDLIIKVDMSTAVPKGLKSLGASLCLVHVGAKTWKKVSEVVKENSFYIISGEVKANTSNKNVPFLEVIAFDISLKPDATAKDQEKKNEKTKVKEKKEPEKQKKEPETQSGLQSQKTQEKSPIKKKKRKSETQSRFKEWYSKEEITYLSHKDIVLVENIHLRTESVQFNGTFKPVREKKTIRSPITVRPLDDGKYALVVGIKHYIAAKIFELEKIPVVVKDMTYNEFLEKYEIRE